MGGPRLDHQVSWMQGRSYCMYAEWNFLSVPTALNVHACVNAWYGGI